MPARFAPDVVVLDGSHPVLWHAKTGRHLSVSPESLAEIERWTPGLAPPPDLRGLARRLDELHLLRESAPADLGALIPCRSRLVLTFPADPALWMPVPAVHPSGGHPWRAVPLTRQELAFWRACNGSRTVAQVAEMSGLDPADFLARMTEPAAQALQLRSTPLSRRDPSLERLVTPARLPNVRTSDMYDDGATSLGAYHADIRDGDTHFDDRETTVAHAFGLPHPGLGGQRYGERLCEVLGVPDGLVVEIGPGDGELGAAFLDRAGRPLDYLRVDASPELLRTQRARMPGTREVLGSATALPLPDRSARLVICNEVIADLAAVPWDGRSSGPPALLERVRRYKLPTYDGLYNVGAWQCLEEIARVLVPGGEAVLTEFGSVEDRPAQTEQLDHPEVSIHFGHLLAVARGLGLSTQLQPLSDLLAFDLRATHLARHAYHGLRARLHREGRRLAARAWTPDTLSLPWPVEGIQWVPLSDEGPGPLVTRFWALRVRR